MEKPSKSSPKIERPPIDYILSAFPEICHQLGFDGEPMYPFDEKNIKILQYYLDVPFTSAFGVEKYQTLTEKASAIFYFVTSNQYFPNGNKRTGVVLTLLFLIWNNKYLAASSEEIYNFSLFVANNHENVDKDLKIVNDFIAKHLIDFVL